MAPQSLSRQSVVMGVCPLDDSPYAAEAVLPTAIPEITDSKCNQVMNAKTIGAAQQGWLRQSLVGSVTI